uniref:Uncharacterized protein n=1 Tax=Panagrolaimus sp. PS1159 TaxID=55785 RepID=A0AC35GSN1_9BILA
MKDFLHAREPPVILPNADILNRDQVYLQKDLQNGKFGRFRALLDDHVNLYKAYLGPDTVVEIGDELKNFLDERIGRLDDVERERRAAESGSI